MMIIEIKGFSPEGFPISLQRDVKDLREAMAFSAAAAKAGITTEPVERREETIVTVVRREHTDDKGRVTPVIDMYPAWKGDYGQFRFLGIYLNSEYDIQQFEARSGLTVDAIPLYNSQAPLQRKQARTHSHETPCKPFVALKRFKGMKDIDGKMQKEWEFIGYGSAVESVGSDPEPAAPRAVLPMPGQLRPAAAPAPNVDQSAPLGGRRNR